MHQTQQWIVDEEHPKPDPYITIFAPGYVGKVPAAYDAFNTLEQALGKARELGRLHQVGNVRIFYPFGRSQLMKLRL